MSFHDQSLFYLITSLPFHFLLCLHKSIFSQFFLLFFYYRSYIISWILTFPTILISRTLISYTQPLPNYIHLFLLFGQSVDMLLLWNQMYLFGSLLPRNIYQLISRIPNTTQTSFLFTISSPPNSPMTVQFSLLPRNS